MVENVFHELLTIKNLIKNAKVLHLVLSNFNVPLYREHIH